MKIIVCAYREWGLKVYDSLKETFPQCDFILVSTPAELTNLFESAATPDMVLCVGWSWKVEGSIIDRSWVVGVHPSDLPNFAGGSPIQNQILSGIKDTKMTLFRLSKDLDQGPIIEKLPLSLRGHIHEIFERLKITSIILFIDFIRKFPDIEVDFKGNHEEKRAVYKRLTPAASQVTRDQLVNLSALELFDLIRCHEDPYPNCYFEDDTGRIVFNSCEFLYKNE